MIVRTAMILSVAAVVSANAGALKLLSLPGYLDYGFDMTSGRRSRA